MSRNKPIDSMAQAWDVFRADYNASRESRFRKRRTGLMAQGSGADYHERNELARLKVMEYARDMVRNDAVAGPLVDTAVANEVQQGFSLNWNTGDKELDAIQTDKWHAWSTDADQCDVSGEHTFHDLELIVSHSAHVDGDIMALPLRTGHLELMEGHRCRTPRNTKRNVVNGVLLSNTRKRLEYWFTRDDIDPSRQLDRVSDIQSVPARTSDGMRLVFHIRNSTRYTQTRGVTSFAPVFDLAGMFEDVQLAKVVQQQIVSCVAFIREWQAGVKRNGPAQVLGQTEVDHTNRLIQSIAPGMEIEAQPGETIKGFSPQVPNAEYFQHVRLMLQLMGINFGVPLCMLLLDGSETNFSGWRGAVDSARRGWERNQRRRINQFHSPVAKWKARQWLETDKDVIAFFNRKAIKPSAFFGKDAAAVIAQTGINPFKHRWGTPRWAYIQPLHDAQAEALRIEKRLTSPRRLQAEHGVDFNELLVEIVEDNAFAIDQAMEAYQTIRKKHGVLMDAHGLKLDWRELLNLPSAATYKLEAGQEEARNDSAA